MSDEFYMRRALELAARAWGRTSPNPMVGAVLVKNGATIGEGFHHRDGGAHAEIECLRSCSESTAGATLYVTLEPCSTRGRTGACTDAIIAAKISSVKIGATDPNPAHAGRAVKILSEAGVDCRSGILEGECSRLNFIFNYSIVEKKALLAIKTAESADGKIAARRGTRTRITVDFVPEAMRWRARFDAIGVGFGTLLADNPKLDVRGFSLADYPDVKSPARLIFDASLRAASLQNLKNFAVFSDSNAGRTRIVCDALADKAAEEKLCARGVSVLRVPFKSCAPEFWDALKAVLFSEGISSLLVEGGANLLASVCAARAADFAFRYRAENLVLGADALDAFPQGRNFEIDGEESRFDSETLKFGRPVWTQKA